MEDIVSLVNAIGSFFKDLHPLIQLAALAFAFTYVIIVKRNNNKFVTESKCKENHKKDKGIKADEN